MHFLRWSDSFVSTMTTSTLKRHDAYSIETEFVAAPWWLQLWAKWSFGSMNEMKTYMEIRHSWWTNLSFSDRCFSLLLRPLWQIDLSCFTFLPYLPLLFSPLGRSALLITIHFNFLYHCFTIHGLSISSLINPWILGVKKHLKRSRAQREDNP